MNARTEPQLLAQLSNAHLDALEEEAIFILREVAAAFERPTLLFSGGKDSLVLLKCAEKAFVDSRRGGKIPYPLLMIDTGHNFHGDKILQTSWYFLRRIDLHPTQ